MINTSVFHPHEDEKCNKIFFLCKSVGQSSARERAPFVHKGAGVLSAELLFCREFCPRQRARPSYVVVVSFKEV